MALNLGVFSLVLVRTDHHWLGREDLRFSSVEERTNSQSGTREILALFSFPLLDLRHSQQ
jgi:hypothetical protein